MKKDKIGRERKDGEREAIIGESLEPTGSLRGQEARSLEVVLKTDSAGSQEAVVSTITGGKYVCREIASESVAPF